jgi:hypothetical protein
VIVNVDPVLVAAPRRIDSVTRFNIRVVVVFTLVCGGAVVAAWPQLIYIYRQNHPPGAAPCATPSGEAQLLQAYQREPALATPPDDTTPQAAPLRGGLYHYCDSVGVDRPTWALATDVWRDYDATGRWPAARLRSSYEGVAAARGWSYIRQADEDQATGSCFTVQHGGTGYCEGNGVLYCRAIEGVTTFLEISDYPQPGLDALTSVRILVEAQWNVAACPPAG